MDNLSKSISQIENSVEYLTSEKREQYMQLLVWLKELLRFREDEENKRIINQKNYYSYFLQMERVERMKEVIKTMLPCMSGCSRCTHSKELTIPGMYRCNINHSLQDEYNKGVA